MIDITIKPNNYRAEEQLKDLLPRLLSELRGRARRVCNDIVLVRAEKCLALAGRGYCVDVSIDDVDFVIWVEISQDLESKTDSLLDALSDCWIEKAKNCTSRIWVRSVPGKWGEVAEYALLPRLR